LAFIADEESNVYRIIIVPDEQQDMGDELPCANPTAVLRVDDNVLQASFVGLVLFSVVSVGELAFVPGVGVGAVDVFLLHFVFIIQEFHKEVGLILHLLDMSSELGPILSCFLPLRFCKRLPTTDTVLWIIFLVLLLIQRRTIELIVAFIDLLLIVLPLDATTHVAI